MVGTAIAQNLIEDGDEERFIFSDFQTVNNKVWSCLTIWGQIFYGILDAWVQWKAHVH